MMSKDYLGGTSRAIPVSPGMSLAALLGCEPGLLFEGIIVAPGSSADTPNVGDVTIAHAGKLVLCGDTALKPGQTTPSKVFRLGSVTVYSANGTEKIVLDGTEVEPFRCG